MTHGSGESRDFRFCGEQVIIENEVLIFHPETITLNDRVYVGHRTILKGYHKGEMIIGEGTWIGQNCFIHSAGSVHIGRSVGIGPGVQILTSFHRDDDPDIPVMHHQLEFGSVVIHDGADIGVGVIVLPGVTIGEGSIIGAGSVVTRSVEAYSVFAGSPARFLRKRK